MWHRPILQPISCQHLRTLSGNSMDRETEDRIWSQISEAIRCGDVYEFQRLVKEYPEWPSSNNALSYPHDLSR
jgi:hypothetical protein